MDYTVQSFSFKLKKTLRYIRLYGVMRTWRKVRGQYHMKKTYDVLPQITPRARAKAHVGIIGCGNFAFGNIAHFLTRNYGKIIQGGMDTDIHKAASLFEEYPLNYYTDDAERLIADPAIDLI